MADEVAIEGIVTVDEDSLAHRHVPSGLIDKSQDRPGGTPSENVSTPLKPPFRTTNMHLQDLKQT